MLDESEFVATSDRILNAIGSALDAAAASSDNDLDWTLKDGILEIECADGSKLVVNRHVPNREIWVAAKSGGFHFAGADGVWRDTRSGDDLSTVLSRLLKLQARIDVALPRFTASPS